MRNHLRALARANMEREGIQGANKPKTFKGKHAPSFFAANWRKYAVMPQKIKEACKKEQADQQRQRAARAARREVERLISTCRATERASE